MQRAGPSRPRLPVVVLGLALTGCTHTYVYGEHAPPTLSGGTLVVPRSSGEERFSIRRIGLATEDEPLSFRAPTSDELATLRAGEMPDGVSTLRIDVDNSGALLRDWALAGFGVGASTVLAAVALSGVIIPEGNGDFGFTVPITLLFASLAGVESMLIGLGLGAGMEGGETDMRYRSFADD